ncbi:Oxidoreductase 2OG-Fe(II) oxygenase family protein [Trichostrongylus colubriformis]|uniref:Oxidoreductase 2OG-Fe(II) oxygenase family protein n=1 Tax=Trichostrongylus colubriformis TaxID=6319 RepID=A0AAN8J316_TRICO
MKLLILALLMIFLMVECESKEKQKRKDTTQKDAKKAVSSPNAKRKFHFVGEENWTAKHLKLCYEQTPLPEDYFCYRYYRNYEVVYIDPISTNPIIFVYRKFIPQEFIDDFLHDVRRKQKKNDEKGVDNAGFMKSFLKNYHRRRANSTTVSRTGMKGVARVFRRAQALIPMLNFNASGAWEVLSFKRGGHHAPHFDYITYASPDQYSRKTRELGNRFATFALTLKAAKVGGDTSFVLLNHTVITSPGDVILFTNINKDMTPTSGAVHGECPVEEGEKITATLWLRTKGQELFNSHSKDESFAFDVEKLILPNMEMYGKSPIYDLHVYMEMMMQQMQMEAIQREAAKGQ